MRGLTTIFMGRWSTVSELSLKHSTKIELLKLYLKLLEGAQKMPEPLLIFDGRYYPDKVARRLILSGRSGDPESHLVPVEEEHLTHGNVCSCEPSWTLWHGHRVVYHNSELSRISVPDVLPEEFE